MNVFFVSLQRTGSNYIEVVLNKNVEEVDFRGYLLNGLGYMHKHCFPKHLDLLKKAKLPQEKFLLVVRNPYMWIESLAFGTSMEDDIEQSLWDGFEKYQLNSKPNIGTKKYNLTKLINLYKDYYTQWMEYLNNNNDIQLIKYEDFLDTEKAKDVTNQIVTNFGKGQVKDTFELHYKPVRYSKNFTQENFLYNKKGKPNKLSKSNIDKITSMLGKDFIQSLGYECYV